MTSLYQYAWPKPESDYEIFRDDEGRSFLLENLVRENEKLPTCWHLESESGLFKEFSALHPLTDDKAVAFANRYGRLGIEVEEEHVHAKPDRREMAAAEYVAWNRREWLATWRRNVERMYYLDRLWSAVNDRDFAVLGEYIEWQVDPDTNLSAVSYAEPGSSQAYRLIGAETAMYSRPSELFDNFKPGDVLGPAAQALRLELNAVMKQHPTTSQLLWEDADYARMSFHQIPKTLLGALWLQFAMAVQGKKQYRQCDQCRRWFEVGVPGPDRQVRGDLKFCSSACRSQADRERKKQPSQLLESGLSLQKLARELDSDRRGSKKNR